MVGFDVDRVHAWIGLEPALRDGLAHHRLEGCAAATAGCAAASSH
jgi:hypothetical protein